MKVGVNLQGDFLGGGIGESWEFLRGVLESLGKLTWQLSGAVSTIDVGFVVCGKEHLEN